MDLSRKEGRGNVGGTGKGSHNQNVLYEKNALNGKIRKKLPLDILHHGEHCKWDKLKVLRKVNP